MGGAIQPLVVSGQRGKVDQKGNLWGHNRFKWRLKHLHEQCVQLQQLCIDGPQGFNSQIHLLAGSGGIT